VFPVVVVENLILSQHLRQTVRQVVEELDTQLLVTVTKVDTLHFLKDMVEEIVH
jgi:hypothetical protein